MTAGRLSAAAVEGLVDQLSERDKAVIRDLARVRVLSGAQLTRLHFSDLSFASRDRARRRVLARLVKLGLAATLDRTIGGVRAGSAGLVYALGVAGQRALPLLGCDGQALPGNGSRARRPWTPGQLFLRHSLAVSELYASFHEAQAAGWLSLGRFDAEPRSWWPDGAGGVVKPDASLCVAHGEVEDSWFVEVDRATESLPTLRRKLLVYVDFAKGGQLGPDGVTPRVLVTVPDEGRMREVREVAARLPEPGGALVAVEVFEGAVERVVRMLRE
jgi:hypothetical protein